MRVKNPDETLTNALGSISEPEYTPHSESFVKTYPETAKRMLSPVPSTPILRMPIFTEATNGFRPHEFSILCGATGTGKTTLLSNWSASLLEQQVPHFVASIENGKEDYLSRIISVQMKEDLNTGRIVPLEKMKLYHQRFGCQFLKHTLWLSKYESRMHCDQLMKDLEWHLTQQGCGIAFIDNINFIMEVTRTEDQIIEMDRTIHNLILFVKKHPIHIVMVMHPRKTMGDGRVMSEFDIKGSSTAVQEAQNVFLFNRPSKIMIEEGKATRFDRALKIQKMRRMGKCVGNAILLRCTDSVSYQEGEMFYEAN